MTPAILLLAQASILVAGVAVTVAICTWTHTDGGRILPCRVKQ